MAQFDFSRYDKKNSDVYFLLNLQADAVSELPTRLVAPLRKADSLPDSIVSIIHIPVKIENRDYVIFISETAGISASELGEPQGNLRSKREEILAAMDLLITGF